MTEAAYLYGIHDKMLQKGHSSYTTYKNDISQKRHIQIYIIGFLKYYQHPADRT